MSADTYRISDEPSPGALAHLAVNPLWPLLAMMFGGIWLSWSWFILNGVAVGSPTRKREWTWVALGLIVSVALLATLVHFSDTGLIAKDYAKYAFLSLVVWKLGVSYVLYELQSHSIELYEYYGGRLRNGMLALVAAYFVGPMVFKAMPPFLRVVMN